MDLLRKFTNAPPARRATQEYADSSLNEISLEYTYAELQKATRNFDESMKLGSGSYGGVFRGVLKDGTQVAIKVLDIPDEAGFEEEVKVLSKFRHPHLVILMGFGRHAAQRFLVYEHLAGGDVHKRLQRSCVEGLPFPWRDRVSIALDAACGLSHLHNSSPKVFHRDIKTPNILLDKNGTAKMADFGLACLSHTSAYKVKQASGTVGYACPLYIQRGVVTEGSEVYSFGMVLFELLTASPPAYMGQSLSNGSSQIQYLAHHINGNLRVALSLVDAKAHWPPTEARAVAELALSCTSESEQQRPSFAEIVRTLRALHEGSSLAAGISPSGMVLPMTIAVAGPPQPKPLAHCPGLALAVARGVSMPSAQQQACVERRFFSPSPLRGAAVHCRPAFPVLPPDRCASPVKLTNGSGSPQLHHRSATPVVAALGRPCRPSRHDGGSVTPMAPPVPAAQKPAFPVAAASPQFQQAAKVGPVLFLLECIFAEGLNINGIPLDNRSLTFSDDGARVIVGRTFQTQLFDFLVPCQSARSVISREHFDIATETVPLQRSGYMSHTDTSTKRFRLCNLSSNGTCVNEEQLQRPGDCAVLRHGDTITLSRSVAGACGPYQSKFLQFRFVVSPSSAYSQESRPDSCEPPRSRGSSSSSVPTIAPALDDRLAGVGGNYRKGEPVFVLEVCGPGVNSQLPVPQRCIAYSPPDEREQAEPQLYTSFTLGRAHQLDFWQNALCEDAFGTLSRQHLEVQTWNSTARNRFSFVVRNLSDINSVHVRGGPEETTGDGAVTLAKGEQQHLLNGYEIVLNLNQEHTFWLIFRDLTASTKIAT